MSLWSPTLSKILKLRFRNIEKWMHHPLEAQRVVLLELLANAQHTAFGIKYHFDKIYNEQEFKTLVPIHEYEQIEPYVTDIMNGQENVLWNTPVNWFAKSSGTTSNKSKFIPITQESLDNCHFKAAKDAINFHYINNPQSNLLAGKGLVIGGSHQVSQVNEEKYFGDLSAVLLQNTPFYGQWIKTPDLSIALMDDWESKVEAMARSTLNENVTSISGVPTWTLVLLKRILEITHKSTIKQVWPNLELYMHGGVAFTPYREQFQKIIGENVDYIDIYNASEGFFALQDSKEAEGMLLMLQHGIYYEFMPIEEYGRQNPKTFNLEQVTLNKIYVLVISTNGGLWRYIPGDTIQFTSLCPFRIKIAGRIKHFINAFGEELIIDNADTALKATCQKMQIDIVDYTAAPVYFSEGQNGAHEWLIEFDTPPQDVTLFATILDEELKKTNSDYLAKRHKNIALRLPIVRILPRGTFAQWLKQKGKLGGQHKVPRLSNDRTIVDEIINNIIK